MREINLQEERLPLGPLLACLTTLKDRARLGEPAPVSSAPGGQRVCDVHCCCLQRWLGTHPGGENLLEMTAVAGQAGLNGYKHRKKIS